MRRLVVGDVLPRDAQPVLRVVHQRIEPMLGWNGGRINPQFLVVGRAPDHFFAPVAENVSAQGGVAFVPLFEAQPSAVSITVSTFSAQFHLKIVLRSSNSLSVSPSQKTPKLQERGSRSDIFSPLALNNPVMPAPLTQHSKPG